VICKSFKVCLIIKKKKRLIRSFSGIDAQFEFDGSNTLKEKTEVYCVAFYTAFIYFNLHLLMHQQTLPVD